MTREGNLIGLKAIVTGGAQGIGEVIAKTLAREGASVAIADMNVEGAKQVASEIEKSGGSALAIKVDVTRLQEVTEMVRRVLDQWGTIDILVNNAGGFDKFSPILEVTEDLWDRIIALNLKSVFLCCQAVAKPMMESRKGRIISIASIGGIGPNPYSHANPPYGSAKAGVIGFTKHLAKELGPYGITVNSISPSTTLSARTYRVRDAETLKRLAERNPMGHLVEPEDIAEAIVFLASDKSRYITGVNLSVNAGTLIA